MLATIDEECRWNRAGGNIDDFANVEVKDTYRIGAARVEDGPGS